MQITTRTVPPRAAWTLEQAGVHPLLARLFAARGIRSPDDLDDSLARLLPPASLKGVTDAAKLLADAIGNQQRLCVVADYDCDGATACAVALRGLRLLGARPEHTRYVVPDRAVHGYGLTPAIVDLAMELRPDVLITVDNGIASLAGVAHARERGLKVLVTDHHLPALDEHGQVTLPDADVIVNPSQPGCPFESKSLAGVGVMFYVLLALRAELRERGAFAADQQPRLDALLDLWRWAPWPTWSSSTPTTAASWPKGSSASAKARCTQAWPPCFKPQGATRPAPAPSTSASRWGPASTPPGAWPT